MNTLFVPKGTLGKINRQCAACHEPYYSWDMYLCQDCGPKGFEIVEGPLI